MAPSTPAIAPSGSTFPDLQAGGWAGLIERLIDANDFAPAVQSRIRDAAGAATGRALAEVVESFARGYAAGDDRALARLRDLVTAAAAILAAAVEVAALISANPGQVVAADPGGARPSTRRRVWH